MGLAFFVAGVLGAVFVGVLGEVDFLGVALAGEADFRVVAAFLLEAAAAAAAAIRAA